MLNNSKNIIPVVAIVGRPNVGKSSLLNRIVGKRHAIVDPTPGVTRDRNYAPANWNGIDFLVVDTGGIDPDKKTSVQIAIQNQVEFAFTEAQAIIFTLDAKDGLLEDDKIIYDLIRKKYSASKKIFIAVNKIDNPDKADIVISEFYKLGIDKIYPISALHGHGIAELLDDITSYFKNINLQLANVSSSKPTISDARFTNPFLNLENLIAIVGKPNVGKSSIFNKLIGEYRSIVDNEPGTTRDTIIFTLNKDGKSYNFIDTAGLRRPDRKKSSVEFYSSIRTLSTIKNSDIALLVLDASTEKLSHQDKRIAQKIIESKCGCIILLNKWDLVSDKEKVLSKFKQALAGEIPLLEFAPIITCSAKSGLRVQKIFDLIDTLTTNGKYKIPQDRLNSLLLDIVTIQPPPPYLGKPVKIYSLEQLEGPPVVFRLTLNYPDAIHFSYERYIINKIREEYDFMGWPISIVYKKYDKKQSKK